MPNLHHRFFIVLLLLSFALMPTHLWAAKIKSIKGKKVLVDMEGDDLKPGQIFSVLKNGKTVGVIKIGKVKNNQALAVLGKGSAEVGLNVKLRPKKSASNTSVSETHPSTGAPKSDSYWGFIAGYSLASGDVSLPVSGVTVALDGSGFSAKGLFDYKLLDSIWFRGLSGLEQFNLGGANNTADCSGECTVEVSYFTFDLWGRLLLASNDFRPWIGLGGSLLFPLSKKATAINQNSITNTNVFMAGGGVDMFVGAQKRVFIPVQIEYNMYPSSDTVEASAIVLRAGFGVPW